METEKSQELWHQLDSEPRRAFEAFQTFLSLPSGGRTVVEAYRHHVGNPNAPKSSDTWSGWSSRFAWRERAAAYDDHLATLRREAYERAVEEEAGRQAREVEKVRGRYNELMTLAYVQAAEWLENAQPSDLRAQDVMRIIGLHMDYVKAFGVEEPRAEDDWTEEDEAQMADLIEEIDAQAEDDELGEDEESIEDM